MSSFIKNLRVYKKLRAFLFGTYKKNVSPELLYLMQHDNGSFERYDVIVRMLAIEAHQGYNVFGIDLYKRMQMAREKYLDDKGVKIKSEDRQANKKDTITSLIKSFKENGFDRKYPIETNFDFKLIDGSHRLACALFFNVKEVTVKRTRTSKVDYGLAWFETVFSKAEIELINTKHREILSTLDIKKVLTEILRLEDQTFGRGVFYQSFEQLGISGQRPTNERFKIYQLDNLLQPHFDVLDIGSNCGFLSLKAAQKVNSVTAVEISETMVAISKAAQNFLHIKNAEFIQGSFAKISLDKKFDFIFSFAVHYWIGLEIKKYAEKLKSLLKPGGLVLFESQDIEKMDRDWDEKIKVFLSVGFEELNHGQLKDDGVINRRFSVLKLV